MIQMLIITWITSTEVCKSKVNIAVFSDLEQRERIWVPNLTYKVKSIFGAFILFV